MPSTATCPQCASQVALPDLGTDGVSARCPACRFEFTTPASASEFRSADTVAYTWETLEGWEERLRQAMESTANHGAAGESAASRATIVEGSPEFDFHLDPPVERSAESLSAIPPILPDSHTWFEGDRVPKTEEQSSEPIPALVSAPRRRRKSAVGKHALAALSFGTLGILLGQYALLWLRGPRADYLQLAGMLPNAIRPPVEIQQNFVPPQFVRDRVAPAPEPRETSPVETITRQLAESKPIEPPPASPVAPPLLHDPAVEPAGAEIAQEPLVPRTNTTLVEFEELVTNARSAASALLSVEPMNSQESTRAKGHAYMAICRLAERFDFVNDLSLGPQAEREAARARTLLRTTAATAALQTDFAKIVSLWWEHAGRSTPGIFLVGRVEDVESVGDHCLYRVAVERPDQTTLIPVLAAGAEFQPGDQIGVVGTIVADPRKALRGFPLNLPQLAVAQDSFAVALD